MRPSVKMSRLLVRQASQKSHGLSSDRRSTICGSTDENMFGRRWKRRIIICCAPIVTLTACAPRASQIAPALMDPYAYETATCRELDEMRAKAQRDRIYADMAQDQQYDDDRTRTFGVPTPMASLFEESLVPHTAQIKADSLAINTQMERAGCIAFNNTGIVPIPKY